MVHGAGETRGTMLVRPTIRIRAAGLVLSTILIRVVRVRIVQVGSTRTLVQPCTTLVRVLHHLSRKWRWGHFGPQRVPRQVLGHYAGRVRLLATNRLVFYCRTASTSTAPRTARRSCCFYAYLLPEVASVGD